MYQAPEQTCLQANICSALEGSESCYLSALSIVDPELQADQSGCQVQTILSSCMVPLIVKVDSMSTQLSADLSAQETDCSKFLGAISDAVSCKGWCKKREVCTPHP